jgi:hypothetical protein
MLSPFSFNLNKMYQRDYILNEARKLARLLAKLMGLKADGEYEEYTKQFDIALQDEYNIELEHLLNLSEEEFKIHILKADYSVEKLNVLSQMLYIFAEPFADTDSTRLILKKVLALFDVMAEKHHFDSFENVEKRNIIYRYFTQQ